ncbi:hypothetical protein IGI04_026460 [Brassica rapa subsp. trilocularis]|uniref:AP2/ERF domain-containing protein n=1 Tax=Brassica rapa subsp. trilocularis TaxID=1813537 RepID=A0ABQ7KWF4_BRACM|nr:hypothetical protein IGI04_026460 [Brassica rapa subsp. trilocularis]
METGDGRIIGKSYDARYGRCYAPYEQRTPYHWKEKYKKMNVSHNSGKKLASTIVTPSRSTLPNDANVTVRSHDAARTITFSPMEKTKQQFPKGDDLIMDALQDMDIAGSVIGGSD